MITWELRDVADAMGLPYGVVRARWYRGKRDDALVAPSAAMLRHMREIAAERTYGRLTTMAIRTSFGWYTVGGRSLADRGD